MILPEALTALAPAVAPPGHRGPSRGMRGPQLCPRMVTTYSQRASWSRRTDPHPWHNGGAITDSDLFAPPDGAAGLGLVSTAKSEKRGRYGLSGLRGAGRREIWRSLRLMEHLRPQTFFWTITLPDGTIAEIEAGAGWSVFQDRVRKELHRLLMERLGFALLIGVAEVQEKRFRRTRVWAPHLHVAFIGKREGWCRWAFEHEDLDRIIVAAAVTAGAQPFDPKAAGNVAPIRASVTAYMAKYMTKGADANLYGLSQENLIPHQWWFRSAQLLAWVQEHVFPLALEFVSWVHRHRRELEAQGLIRHQIVEGLPESAPVCWRVDWRGPPELAEVIAQWQEDEWEAEWWNTYRASHVGTDTGQHPVTHQHL